MKWVNENKFLTGLIAAVVVGAGVLLFLLNGARAKYAETQEQYTQQANELQRLQSLKPFPAEESLAKLQEQKQAYTEAASALRAKLSGMELEVQPMTPEQFQDTLRATVSRIQTLAAEKKAALPADFYLGFPEYQASPPRSEAAARLGWQLKTLDFVLTTLLNSRVASIESIDREPLPEEGRGPRAEPDQRPGAAAGKPAEKLLERYPFTIGFTADQSRFRAILNKLTTAKEQFLIVESLSVKNEKLEGPPRLAPGQTSIAGSDLPAPTSGLGEEALTGGEAPGAQRLEFILGTERLAVVLQIAAVDFVEPGAEAKPARP